MKKKILALVSNPKGSTNLDLLPEIRNLQEALQRSQHRERFDVEWKVAVRQSDLRRHILDVKPQIIHFCGHGKRDGLVLEDARGTAKIVSNAFIVDLLSKFADRIECVLLNACNSEPLANEISKHINYAIGMNQPVFDDAAIVFSEGFYDTLGAGESIERAFEVGRNAVLGEVSTEEISSDDVEQRKFTATPEDDNHIKIRNREHLIPVLKQNSNPTPIKPIWLSPKQEQKAVRQLLTAIEDRDNKIRLFHTTEPIILQDQYIPVQVTLERRYQHTVETTWGYAESEAELRRIYALKGSGEEEIKRQQVDWQKAKRQESRIVVLADPGMGKSTLLRMEVCRTVEQSYQALDKEEPVAEIAIPLLIRLSSLAEKIAKMPAFEAILEIIQERHSNLLRHERDAEVVAFLNDFLKEQLLKGKCVLLLDALDEVTQEKRQQLIEKLNDFARAYPSCKIIGTSRIVGYGGRLVDGAKDMEIVPFTQQETERYIETWFINARDSLTDKSITAKGLIQALRGRPQIGGLAQNPLLLSLICSLYQKDKLKLPARRGQIYKESVDYMLDEWRRTRPNYSRERTEAKIRLLEAMAYYFTYQEQEVFDYEELYEWIEEYLDAGDAPRDLRDAKTGELIAELSEEDGILQKLYRDENDDQYLFLHRTFQEYLTASFLNRIIKKKPEEGIALVRQYFWNYDWHETLTLLAGLMKQPMLLIEAILSTRDDIFNTQLLLAGRCIAECNEISDPLIDQTIDRIYQFWLKHPNFEFISSVVVAIGQTYEQIFPSLKIALYNEDTEIRKYAASILGRIGDERAVDRLFEIALDAILFNPLNTVAAIFPNVNLEVVRSSIWALGEIGKSNNRAVNALIAILQGNYSSVKIYSAQALGAVGNERTVEALIQLLQDEDSDVRKIAAEVLGKIGNERAVDALITALYDENSSVCSEAARALGEIGSERAVDALITAALHGEKSYIRAFAARALGKIGNERVIEVLSEVFYDENSDVRESVVWALSKIGIDWAIDNLIALLHDENSVVREEIWEFSDIGNERVVDALITLLQDENPDVRDDAAFALGEVGSERAIDALIVLLQDENSNVRDRAAWALGEIGGERAIDALIALLHDENSWFTSREKAANALGKIGNERAVNALITALYDENFFVCSEAAWALGKIGSEQAVESLNAALGNENSLVRGSTAKALGEIGSPVCLEKLLQSAQLNIDDNKNFSLARSLAIRFSKQELSFVPVYPEFVGAIVCSGCHHPNSTDGKVCTKCGKRLSKSL